jgi:hypothetical protein
MLVLVKKKNCKGFPMFFTMKNFQTALMGDLKLWWSRHHHRRHRRCCRGRSNVEGKKKRCKKKRNRQDKDKGKQDRGRRRLTVRSSLKDTFVVEGRSSSLKVDGKVNSVKAKKKQSNRRRGGTLFIPASAGFENVQMVCA